MILQKDVPSNFTRVWYYKKVFHHSNFTTYHSLILQKDSPSNFTTAWYCHNMLNQTLPFVWYHKKMSSSTKLQILPIDVPLKLYNCLILRTDVPSKFSTVSYNKKMLHQIVPLFDTTKKMFHQTWPLFDTTTRCSIKLDHCLMLQQDVPSKFTTVWFYTKTEFLLDTTNRCSIELYHCLILHKNRIPAWYYK